MNLLYNRLVSSFETDMMDAETGQTKFELLSTII